MINSIPILGWLISLAINASMAVPFWVCWTACGLGNRYFMFLPSQFRSIPFWDCVGLFLIASVLKVVLVPKVADVTVNNEEKD